jgi:hypothetical protein
VLKHITKWELCSTKDHYKMTEPHTYTQKIHNQQQRCARVSMAQRLLSQTGSRTPLSDAALTQHGLRKKFYDRATLGRPLYLPGQSFLDFDSWSELKLQLPAPTSINCSVGIRGGRDDLAPGERGDPFSAANQCFGPFHGSFCCST